MSNLVAWIGAEAARPEIAASAGFPRRTRQGEDEAREIDLPAADEVLQETEPTPEMVEAFSFQQRQREGEDRERKRRTYHGRAVAMLRRYMRYSIETGRLPSLLGREFFRAKVTAYTVVTFEDRVIFVHDMEKCLEKLDEFSRQLIARHILQEHDQAATGKLLHCTERTVRTYVPIVLDVLVEILLDVGLMERLDSDQKNSCQGGKNDQILASNCDDGKYKV
jgi:DNA-directed RNA polymerase specialized sigma24 family protein